MLYQEGIYHLSLAHFKDVTNISYYDWKIEVLGQDKNDHLAF